MELHQGLSIHGSSGIGRRRKPVGWCAQPAHPCANSDVSFFEGSPECGGLQTEHQEETDDFGTRCDSESLSFELAAFGLETRLSGAMGWRLGPSRPDP